MQTDEYNKRAGVWAFRVVRPNRITYFRTLADAKTDAKKNQSATLQRYIIPTWVDVELASA